MGSIFFNSQIPKLIRALQDIASALSKPAPAAPDGTALFNPIPAIKMDDMAEPNFLHDLLYWMYETEVFGNRAQLASFDADVTQAEGLLMPALAQSRELFEQYQSAVSRRNDAEIERAFCCGYRAGANALLNGLFITQDLQEGGKQNGQ
nr:hypothetical protein [uncultured Acetatifactor sp.]